MVPSSSADSAKLESMTKLGEKQVEIIAAKDDEIYFPSLVLTAQEGHVLGV